MNEALPAYTDAAIKEELLAAGASGTVYSLVMPESEAILAEVIDADRDAFLDIYREAWTQKQDSMHEEYFERWIAWSAPVVDWDADRFPFRYPTAGASEGIAKLMGEYAARCRTDGIEPEVHFFEGEYEGFPAYADSFGLTAVRHPRSEWEKVVAEDVPAGAQFWISQPSAIDGAVWPHFEAFAAALHAAQPDAELVPDLTYVGNVARSFSIALDAPNIRSFVMSQSKPFGGYYHRVGGVFSSQEKPSLFGNKWFKNLLSLRWASAMLDRFGVHELPAKYRPVQEEAARLCGKALGIDLQPAEVNLLASAPYSEAIEPPLDSVGRGCAAEKIVRLCVTPAMASLIDVRLAPDTGPQLLERWELDEDR